MQPFSNGVSKWKSETVLNLRQPEPSSHNLNLISPTQKKTPLPQASPEPHLTFPRSFKVPPPTPVRTSSIPSAEKESSPKDEQFPKMVPHNRPSLPPNFGTQPEVTVHSEGNAKDKPTLETLFAKPSLLVTEPESSKLTVDVNGSPTSQQNCVVQKEQSPQQEMVKDSSQKLAISPAQETELPSPDSASLADGDWKERSNLDKLKNELSVLLSSSYRKDDRQLDKPAIPKIKASVTDSSQLNTNELQQSKSVVTGLQSPARTEGELKEKTSTNVPSVGKAFTSDVSSTPDNKSTTNQANCIIKLKNELEALLSPSKDGGPPLALVNLRHNPETKKQVTLQFGGNQINGGEFRLSKSTECQNTSVSDVTEKEPKIPSVPFGNPTPDNSCKPPAPPPKPKDALLLPASPRAASPLQTPSMDFSHLQYQTHRSRFNSTESLPAASSSQTAGDGPASTNNNENQRDSTEHMTSDTHTLSRNAQQTNSDVLFHPVTGEKVERGSPMALLLAAQQRAQKSKSSGSTSRRNSYLSEKPHFKLSERLPNSDHSETGSSTIYYNDSKPNSVMVIPKSPQREFFGGSERKQHNGANTSDSKVWGLPELEQRAQNSQLVSSGSEQCRNVQKLRSNDSRSLSTSNRDGSSILVRGLLDSSHLKQQDHHSMPDTSLNSLSIPQSHTSSNTNELEEEFHYEIIPPPPEFSNEASGVPGGSSNGQRNNEGLNISNNQAADKQLKFNYSSYNYGNGYSLTSKPTLESSRMPSGYSHHYTGGTYSANYLSRCANSRPLIKKRLYMTESDGSYVRPAMSSRSMSTPSCYGHNTTTYNSSQSMEGIRRVNSAHRNVPSNVQGRRVSLELPGKMLIYNNVANEAKFKGQNGEYAAASVSGRYVPLAIHTRVMGYTMKSKCRPVSDIFVGKC